MTPRPVRAAVGEAVEITLTVTGSPVTFSVPARLTPADALRNRLGLTGTHLGCEHGVCGMCTVVVDGAAARSCLLFAGQLDGSEILTVEGLGRPDDLHPLQEAFGRHHALQCGFCTPGFLLSAYDLLSHRPDVADDELPDELSGVLCRCTGYRNILAAVADVAHRYRDGLPAPKACAPRVLLAAGGTGVPAAAQECPAQREEPDRVRLPAGEPTFTVAVSRELAAPVDAVWRVVSDVDLLAGCLPGAELTERLDEHRARGPGPGRRRADPAVVRRARPDRRGRPRRAHPARPRRSRRRRRRPNRRRHPARDRARRVCRDDDAAGRRPRAPVGADRAVRPGARRGREPAADRAVLCGRRADRPHGARATPARPPGSSTRPSRTACARSSAAWVARVAWVGSVAKVAWVPRVAWLAWGPWVARSRGSPGRSTGPGPRS
jgi:aerobic-type carbon monoxide dehydrogenase small subunit (CoxS/CutS family)